MINQELTEENTRNRDMWRKFVLGEGKLLYNGIVLGRMNE